MGAQAHAEQALIMPLPSLTLSPTIQQPEESFAELELRRCGCTTNCQELALDQTSHKREPALLY